MEIKRTENGFTLKDENITIDISLSTALALSEFIDEEYCKEDVKHFIDDEYGKGAANKLSARLLDEIVEEYKAKRSESEEWLFLCKEAVVTYKNDIKAGIELQEGKISRKKWYVEFTHAGQSEKAEIITIVDKSDLDDIDADYYTKKYGLLSMNICSSAGLGVYLFPSTSRDGHPLPTDIMVDGEKDIHRAMLKAYFGSSLIKANQMHVPEI